MNFLILGLQERKVSSFTQMNGASFNQVYLKS